MRRPFIIIGSVLTLIVTYCSLEGMPLGGGFKIAKRQSFAAKTECIEEIKNDAKLSKINIDKAWDNSETVHIATGKTQQGEDVLYMCNETSRTRTAFSKAVKPFEKP